MYLFPITPYKTLQSQNCEASRGLTAHQSISEIVEYLEERVRTGHYNQRKNLQDLIPVAANISRFKHGLNLWMKPGRKVILDINSTPDIFVYLMRAMCGNKNNEDEMVSHPLTQICSLN